MKSFEILIAPDPRLQERALSIEKVDSSIRQLMDQLLETMYIHKGLGLASIQVGIKKRVIVIDLGERDEFPTKPLFIANPELLWVSPASQTIEEGCLSVPGQYADVVRPLEVHLSYLDENNKMQLLTAKGLLADCIQHEIDHLNGILFIEHLSFLKKKLILNRLVKENKYNKGMI